MLPYESFEPSPWLLGLAGIAAGIVLWWLTPDVVDDEERTSRFLLGGLSPFAKWPKGMRSYHRMGNRFGSVLCVVLGLVSFGIWIAR